MTCQSHAVAAAVAALPACAVVRQLQGDRIARVNPASIAAAPANGTDARSSMVGLLVWEPDNLGLYQSYGAYCRRGEQSAIHVDWSQWPGVPRRQPPPVTVRGSSATRHAAGAGEPRPAPPGRQAVGARYGRPLAVAADEAVPDAALP